MKRIKLLQTALIIHLKMILLNLMKKIMKKMLNLTQTQKILIIQITILTKLLKTLKNSLKALRLQQQKKLNLHHFQLKFILLILLGKTIFK